MSIDETILKDFFAAYEARTNKALQDPPEVDAEATADAFAECFVEASPKGVSCGKNDEQFREVIPKGFDFYRSLGTKAMKIVSLETTPLDDLHAVARVHWEAFYERKDGRKERIGFDVIYLVQQLGDKPRIFAYVTGDEEQLYREKGLVPE